ncbi:MAG TPA: hypothetical protein VNF07_03800, partial [Acidimicrobiales bacterium]|nr:hypothetical protein [Acidimicrobiales bacterium]
MTNTSRSKTYVAGPSDDIRVPFTEVQLASADGTPAPACLHLYDTSGPGSDPNVGLPALREPWIVERNDVVEYEGRRADRRDD